MTINQAKLSLLTCRPLGPERAQPEIAEALALAREDATLKEWFRAQTAFQQTLQRSFRELPVPADLKQRILARAARAPISRPTWWQRPPLLAAAAAIVLLLGLSAFWLTHHTSSTPTFETFRSRMVRNVIRQYTMVIKTNDMTAVRNFLQTQNAPADYELPDPLAQLPVLGADILSWADHPVSMVCFQSPDAGVLFLFVLDQAKFPSLPPSSPEYLQVSELMTASWSKAGRTYILATTGSRESLRRRF